MDAFASGVEVTQRALETPESYSNNRAVYLRQVFGIGMCTLPGANESSEERDYFLAGRDSWMVFHRRHPWSYRISPRRIFSRPLRHGRVIGAGGRPFEWLCRIILWFWVGCVVPFYCGNVFTMPEFLDGRFNRQWRCLFAAISIISLTSLRRYPCKLLCRRRVHERVA